MNGLPTHARTRTGNDKGSSVNPQKSRKVGNGVEVIVVH